MLLRLPWRSLRTSILAWSFVPTAIILLAVALVTFYAYQRVTEDLVVGRNREVTRFSAGQLGGDMRQYSDVLVMLTRTYEMYSGDPALQARALAVARDRLIAFDGGVVALDVAGRVTASYPVRNDIASEDWSNRSYYRELLRSAGPVFSDIVSDGRGGTDVIVVAVPIIDARGETRGIVAGMFDLGNVTVSSFYGTIAKLRIGDGGDAYLVDSRGRVVYSTGGRAVGTSLADQPVVQQVLSRRVGDLRTGDAKGREIAASYAPVSGTPWGLVTEEEWSELMAPSRGYQQFLMVLLVLGVIVPSVVVAFGVRRITHSLGEFIAAAQEVAGGDFSRTVTSPFGGELESLAEQFNSMSRQLRESYANMERRVQDRTRELATLNAIVAAASASLDLEEVLHEALDKTLEATAMEAGAAYGTEEGSDQLVLMAQRGMTPEFTARAGRLALADVAPESVVGTFRPSICHIGTDCDIHLRSLFMNEGLQMAVSVPLVAKGQLLGVMNLGTRSRRSLSEEEISLLGSIGQQVGVAMDNARLYEKAEESAAAAERSRLARDLHDAVSQTLFSASLIAEVLPKLWDRNPQEASRRLEELRVLTRGALAEMRTLLLELRPSALQEAQVVDLMRQLAEAATARARLPVTYHVSGECQVSPEVKMALYRIAQEALNNVIKHSGASQVSLTLECLPDRVELEIADDGRGFDPASAPPDHLGLGIMRERAEAIGAKLTLDSQPGEGTNVNVVWSPVGAPALKAR